MYERREFMYISLYDLGLFTLFIILIIVSGYLIAVLHRTFCVLGYVRGILGDHTEDIHEIISGLPEALTNANELAISLKETADQTNGAFGSIQDNLTNTVDDLRDGMETFAVYAKIAGEVCRAVFSKSA